MSIEKPEAVGDPDSGAPIGYLPRWSYRSSDELEIHVSCHLAWEADLVRLHYGDPRSDGPGLRETPIEVATGAHQPIFKVTQPGSMAWAPVHRLPAQFALVAWVRPTNPARGTEQVALALQSRESDTRLALCLGPDGRWTVMTYDATPDGLEALAVPEWQLVQLAVDTKARTANLTITGPQDRTLLRVASASSIESEKISTIAIGGALIQGGATDEDDPRVFDGAVAEPCLVNRPLSPHELERIMHGARVASVATDGLLASWTFPAAQPPLATGVATAGAIALRNTPARAMPGPHGTFDAVHFHSDDITDAEWPVAVRLSLPRATPSGVYAVRLRSEAGCDRIPFIVRADATSPARALLLLPTMTYLAYANDRMPAPGSYLERFNVSVEPTTIDRWLARHPEYGASNYDCHTDGSGVIYSSLRRPIPNIRPNYLHWVSGEPRHLGADLFIVDWLDRTGIAYDVACDHDLDAEGFSLLGPYSVVITGSHPEYWSTAMLDALEQHLDLEGRLMYLGGNGFYWVTSTSSMEPGTIEVRRGYKGQMPWRSGEGEATHAFDGVEGGLWAAHGRAPQDLVGITCVAMGAEYPAPGYILNPELPALGHWLIEGLEAEAEIGTSGRLMGGAAGHEMDIVDMTDGLPEGVTIIGSSSGHADGYVSTAQAHAYELGLDVEPHADLVLYRRPGGGTIFSTGSICWSGSLAEDGGDPAVQRLTENVLRRFSSPMRT